MGGRRAVYFTDRRAAIVRGKFYPVKKEEEYRFVFIYMYIRITLMQGRNNVN